MTAAQIVKNTKAVALFGWAPFQSQGVTVPVMEYISAGGTIHKMNNGTSLCGNQDGVGYTKRNSGITCLNCRREMNKRIILKKGRAA